MPKCIERWLRANGSRHISTIRYLHWANTFATEPYLNTFSMCRRARGVQQKAKIEKPFFLENGCILCRWRVECREFDAANNKNGWCSYTIYQRTNYVFGVHWYIGGVCSAFFFCRLRCYVTVSIAFCLIFPFSLKLCHCDSYAMDSMRPASSYEYISTTHQKHLRNFPFWTFGGGKVFSASNVRLAVITFFSSDIPITESAESEGFCTLKPNLISSRYWGRRVLLVKRTNE